jgi:hypothetical protein
LAVNLKSRAWNQRKVPCQYVDYPCGPGWRTAPFTGILLSVQMRGGSMLTAAIDLWLLPAALFFEAFAPASKPVADFDDARVAFALPLTCGARRARRRRKVIRSKRGD